MEPLVFIGIVLILSGALVLAVGMNLQQFALQGDLRKVSYIVKRLGCFSGDLEQVQEPPSGHRDFGGMFTCTPRNVLWIIGMSIYLLAQGFVTASLALAPFALVSALFASVLVWNQLIAMAFHHKRFNQREITGMVIVVGALAVCAPNSPNESYKISPDFIAATLEIHSAVAVIVLLFIMGLVGVVTVRAFEKQYPFSPETSPEAGNLFVPPSTYRQMQLIYPMILGTCMRIVNHTSCPLTSPHCC
jgi:drug/metabolite transporter (DMT)-like permease